MENHQASYGASAHRFGAEPEVERLQREHDELKGRLETLNRQPYLNAEEEIERKTIQKLKLATKDRLAYLVGRQSVG